METPLAEMGVAAALGAACGLFAMDGVRTPAIARALASLGPHPTVASISESLAFGHPMVRAVGGVWVQSVPSLWITAASRRRIDENPGDEALAERLRPYIDAIANDWSRTSTATAPTRCWSAGSTRAFTNGRGTTPRSPRRGPTIASTRPRPTGLPRRTVGPRRLVGLRPALPDGEVGADAARGGRMKRRNATWTRRPGPRMNSLIESFQAAEDAPARKETRMTSECAASPRCGRGAGDADQ